MTSGQKKVLFPEIDWVRIFLTHTRPYSPICISVSELIFCFKKQIKQNTHTNIQQKELKVNKKRNQRRKGE